MKTKTFRDYVPIMICTIVVAILSAALILLIGKGIKDTTKVKAARCNVGPYIEAQMNIERTTSIKRLSENINIISDTLNQNGITEWNEDLEDASSGASYLSSIENSDRLFSELVAFKASIEQMPFMNQESVNALCEAYGAPKGRTSTPDMVAEWFIIIVTSILIIALLGPAVESEIEMIKDLLKSAVAVDAEV